MIKADVFPDRIPIDLGEKENEERGKICEIRLEVLIIERQIWGASGLRKPSVYYRITEGLHIFITRL